jgi:hypothetical protein
MTYRFEAASTIAFVQQLALSYIGPGYWFYMTGVVPERKEPRRVDEKLVEQYDEGLSKWAWARGRQNLRV